jgi:hypothetical protein
MVLSPRSIPDDPAQWPGGAARERSRRHIHHSRQSKHRPDLEVTQIGGCALRYPGSKRRLLLSCRGGTFAWVRPRDGEHRTRSGEEEILCGGDEAVPLSVVRRRAYRGGVDRSVGKPQTPRRLAPESVPSGTSLEGGCGVFVVGRRAWVQAYERFAGKTPV